jgi:integrase
VTFGLDQALPVIHTMGGSHGFKYLRRASPSALEQGQTLRSKSASETEGNLGHSRASQYARVVRGWIREIGLDVSAYGTHTMRRTKASLIYKRTKNLRVVQLLLGHSKLESTVRYLGIEVDDALEMAEQTEV